jgi:predicted transcriptional regulator of viral defense system
MPALRASSIHSERISFRAFEEAFSGLPAISISEIRMHFPALHRSRLSQWQSKGYLQKIRNGYYRLASRPMHDHERWAIANTIVAPSYVSLRSALAFHGFIPEGVFQVESITTEHTKRISFEGTEYSYRSVRPSLYFGYRFVEQGGVRVMMASAEKALLDLLYHNPDLNSAEDFGSWRLDAGHIMDSIDVTRMDDFAQLAGSKALLQRYTKLKSWLHDHA